MDSKNSQTTPATTSTAPAHQPLGLANAETTAAGASATQRSDPTQHAKGRTGDCPGPRKGATTRRTVTQGGLGNLIADVCWAGHQRARTILCPCAMLWAVSPSASVHHEGHCSLLLKPVLWYKPLCFCLRWACAFFFCVHCTAHPYTIACVSAAGAYPHPPLVTSPPPPIGGGASL